MRAFFALLLLSFGLNALADDGTLRIGSKRFTEGYILSELVTQTAAPHVKVEHRQGLGNTAIVLAALKNGSIDLYPEYVGTIDQEILQNKKPATLDEMRRALATMGLGLAVPLGFNNTYALAVRGDADLQSLSDLARHPELRFGLSHEFIGRADGWPGLAQRYGLAQQPRGLDHGIAYEALAAKQVDVIDIYSTDAKIARYHLKVLRDDRAYFPRYDAMLLYRLDTPARFPRAWQAIAALEGKITERDMIAMNAAAELAGQPFAAVAKNWLMKGNQTAAAQKPARASFVDVLFGDDLARLTGQHVLLVVLSVLLACVAGIPLGVLAALQPRLRQPVLAFTGVLQTVPSLALLAMLIPLLGTIGTVPALVALFVYALLPIVRNTCTGILGVAPGLRQAALALGLTPRQRLWHVDLPLALPIILAGVKTAAVMSVGTATIAAFIGAGGYGERITTGLALNDNATMLAGAIPAAALALLTQLLFELLERRFTNRQGATRKV
ncbi:osmoprotectant transport system permease protein [Pseudoduganella lurida]|uniref:Osmoprotectant transport system permease protein n=1 Tax=Pseudoduganella lurida TaxID=1036180 RepID=A0A562RAW4_9BURK|nr:glycine betaine ABC transporter substrate-binding protein [Pseudoduganella lurida]TWI66222.1 osmoprotectant transport system permease protein [Pseudoduganella lurida]